MGATAPIVDKARFFKSAATDMFEDGAYKAKRAWKRGARGVADYREDAKHHVRRRPFSAVGTAAAVGLFLGVAVMWLFARETY